MRQRVDAERQEVKVLEQAVAKIGGAYEGKSEDKPKF